MYRLADEVCKLRRLLLSPSPFDAFVPQLGLKDLKDKARKDIESKLSEHNILVELFSSFTAR